MELFLAALDRPEAADRAAYLDEVCAGDEGLRQRLEELLRAHDATDRLLDQPAVQHLAAQELAASLDFLEPSEEQGVLGCLGRFQVLEILGRGGMGTVLKARDPDLDRVVALKVIRRERLAHRDGIRRFQREAKAVARLFHSNIVAIYDTAEANGTHFLVMEYVEGIDLDKLVVQRGPLPVAEACDAIRQAALGFEHAHEKGLVHRDIKPANLMRTPHGTFKILDMGLARLVHGPEDGDSDTELTQDGWMMGTPDFMAPEQFLDPHSADIRADVYNRLFLP
jgi:serine/threonine protein kinase